MSKPKYETNVKPYLSRITEWAKLGAEEREIARKLDISPQSMSVYKKEHSELVEALKEGRQDLVYTLKGKLVQLALGEVETVTTKTYTTKDKDGKTKQHAEQIKVQQPPSVAAIQILLKNWDEGWSDKPAELKLKREELEFKKMLAEQSDWATLEVVDIDTDEQSYPMLEA